MQRAKAKETGGKKINRIYANTANTISDSPKSRIFLADDLLELDFLPESYPPEEITVIRDRNRVLYSGSAVEECVSYTLSRREHYVKKYNGFYRILSKEIEMLEDENEEDSAGKSSDGEAPELEKIVESNADAADADIGSSDAIKDDIGQYMSTACMHDLLGREKESNLAKRIVRLRKALASLVFSNPRAYSYIVDGKHNLMGYLMAQCADDIDERRFRTNMDTILKLEKRCADEYQDMSKKESVLRQCSNSRKLYYELISRSDPYFVSELLIKLASYSLDKFSRLDKKQAEYYFFRQDSQLSRYISLLRHRYEQYNEARQEFASHNCKLVVSIAKKYRQASKLSFMDLIGFGSLGLMKGLDKFDPERGYRFSTFCSWWIRQSIRRAMNDLGRAIRIPAHQHEEIYHVKLVHKTLKNKLMREPTPAELVSASKKKHDTVMLYIATSKTPKSFDQPIGQGRNEESGNDAKYGDFIEDRRTEDISRYIDLMLLSKKIDFVLGTLTPREKMIIKLRYGINEENETYTLEEVGKKLGVTRERVRQIEAKALRKLQHTSRARYLAEYAVELGIEVPKELLVRA